MLHPARRIVSRPRWSSLKRHYAWSSLHATLRKNRLIDIHPEVQDALSNHKPVVALETTIVTHGMPYPVNLTTARSVETIVRQTGALPATIGIIGGRVKIGLEPNELEYLADVGSNPSVVKISRRDIGPAISMKRDGGTTCSATLIFAALAGIKVFATGGLGGVHRHGETSMDISADLHELTRCPVGLVSAGVKSILDIGRTLEYLETLGVPVLSYAETDDFPAFYSRCSGFKSPWRVDDPTAAARILYAQEKLGMANGVLFGVPIPEQYEAIGGELQTSIEQALQEAEDSGVSRRGKEVTPWLLKRVGELTGGKSLASNVALIENTALVGGQIAVAYAELTREYQENSREEDSSGLILAHKAASIGKTGTSTPRQSLLGDDMPQAKLVVFGSAAVDITAQARSESADPSVGLQSTVPGSVSLTLGGVGRNVAEAAHRTLTSHTGVWQASTLLVSPIGDDPFGYLLVDEMRRIGMRTDGLIQTDGPRSSVCNLVLDSEGSLMGGVADMDIINTLDKDTVLHLLRRHKPVIAALDGNLSQDTLKFLVHHCIRNNIAVFFEPTSVYKSTSILPAIATSFNVSEFSDSPITFAAPNLLELAHMYQETYNGPLKLAEHNYWWTSIDSMNLGSEFRMDLERLARLPACDHNPSKGTLSFLIENGVAQMAIRLLPFFRHLIIKCGDRGVITVFRVYGQGAAWTQERSNVQGRYVIAPGRPNAGVTVLKHFPALMLEKEKIINVTGAGDSLVGSILASLLQNIKAFEDPSALETLIGQAQRAALLTLQSQYAVSPSISILEDARTRDQ